MQFLEGYQPPLDFKGRAENQIKHVFDFGQLNGENAWGYKTSVERQMFLMESLCEDYDNFARGFGELNHEEWLNFRHYLYYLRQLVYAEFFEKLGGSGDLTGTKHGPYIPKEDDKKEGFV